MSVDPFQYGRCNIDLALGRCGGQLATLTLTKQELSVLGLNLELIADLICRNCLGQQLAKINVPTAVAMLIREFHMTLAPQVYTNTLSPPCPPRTVKHAQSQKVQGRNSERESCCPFCAACLVGEEYS